MIYERTICPRCNRTVTITKHRYANHSTAPGNGNLCHMSLQRIPTSATDPDSYEARADLIADLAEQVQDADPAVVWDYLNALPTDELPRLLMVALAGIPVDRHVDDIFAWVRHLPAAQLQETA